MSRVKIKYEYVAEVLDCGVVVAELKRGSQPDVNRAIAKYRRERGKKEIQVRKEIKDGARKREVDCDDIT